MATKKKGGADERRIEDRKLERELAVELDFAFADTTKEVLKRHRSAKKQLQDAIELLKLKPGQRLRIGEHVILGAERRGGGFEVPTWTKTIPTLERTPTE